MATPMELVRELSAGMRTLNDGDRRFATSLLDGFAKYGSFTDKQLYWVNKMLERVRAGGQVVTTIETVGDLAGVYALFNTAKQHLKFPAIVLGYTRGHEQRELRITVATAKSSTPNALQVKDEESGTWFGRIHTDGRFEHSRRDAPPSGLTQVLRAFAAEPAKVAAEHGHLTGKCCFCNRQLTDERSTAVGYGATCAEHFGLPWGAKAAKAATARLVADEPDLAGEEEFDRAEDRAIRSAEDQERYERMDGVGSAW